MAGTPALGLERLRLPWPQALLGTVAAVVAPAAARGWTDRVALQGCILFAWPPSQQSAPLLSALTASFVLLCMRTFFCREQGQEALMVRAEKRRLLLAQMAQALKWKNAGGGERAGVDQEVDSPVSLESSSCSGASTSPESPRPPSVKELFDMLFDSVEERHVREYGIDENSEPYVGVRLLFAERVVQELGEAVRWTQAARDALEGGSMDEAWNALEVKLLGEYRDGAKLTDLIKLCEKDVSKHFRGVVPRGLLASAKECQRRLNAQQREGVAKLFAMVVPLLPLYSVGGALMLFDSFTGAALWHSLSTVLDGVQDGSVSMEDVKWLTVDNYVKFVFCIFAHMGSWAFTGKVTSQFRLRVRAEVMRSLVKQDIKFFDIIPSGVLQERLNNDADALASKLFHLPMRIIHCMGMLISNLYAVYCLRPELFAMIFGPLPVVSVLQYFIIKALNRLEERQRSLGEQAAAGTMEVLKEIRTVREFAMEDEEASKFNASGAYRASIEEYGCALQHIVFLSPLVCTMCAVRNLTTFASGFFVLSGQLSVGQACQVAWAADHLQHCMRNLMFLAPDVVKVLGPLGRVCDLLEARPGIEPRAGDSPKLAPDAFAGRVEFRAVDFTFPAEPNKQILRQMSFEVNPGERIAFVGPTGCGKSTCIRLIERFYDPCHGEVLIDQRPVSAYDVYYLRRKLSVVAQDNVLFSTTIRENVTYGLPRAKREAITDEEIEVACTKANAWGFIQEFPRKLETYAGERGVKLSGGQKQRLAIARAIIRNPTIVLLDEATSALDSKSEEVVQAALDRMIEGHEAGCTIMIAHRLATVRKCDRIYAMDRGHIVENGSHLDLLQVPIVKDGSGNVVAGMYRDLWETQMGGCSGVAPDKELRRLRAEVSRLREIAYKLPGAPAGPLPPLGKVTRADAPTHPVLLTRSRSAGGEEKCVLPPARLDLRRHWSTLAI